MILYTIMPMDVVMQNEVPVEQNKTRIIQYDRYQLEVTMANGQAQVQRIFSTNPRDYLNPKLQPGSIIRAIDN